MDVSTVGDRNRYATRLDGPGLPKPVHRLRQDFVWDGSELLVQSRTVDGFGNEQPSKNALGKAKGENARSRVGPHLNGVLGHRAGSTDGFRFSRELVTAGGDGLIWDDSTMDGFIERPRSFIKGSRMSFVGLKRAEDRSNLIAYLKTSSSEMKPIGQTTVPLDSSAATTPAARDGAQVARPWAKDAIVPSHGTFHLGREALPSEVAAWDVDIRPDSTGLPMVEGKFEGGDGFNGRPCATCRGDFGKGRDRWPVLAVGHGTHEDGRPERTIGSYWLYLSTVFDYVCSTMPFGNAQSLSAEEVYAITAQPLKLNDVVTEESLVLTHENFSEIRLPHVAGFISGSRGEEQHAALSPEPCSNYNGPTEAKVLMRVRILDVTPDSDESEAAGAIE